MTVQQLIAILQTKDQDMEVLRQDNSGGYEGIYEDEIRTDRVWPYNRPYDAKTVLVLG